MGEDSWVCPSEVLREGRHLPRQDQGLAKITHVTLGFPDPCSPRARAKSLLWVVVSCKAPSDLFISVLFFCLKWTYSRLRFVMEEEK